MASPKETLALSQQRALSWNEFDDEWYRRVYAISPDIHDALEYFFTDGQKRGHSPNVFFEEQWYRGRYPDVAASILAGHFVSGFDHYCHAGLTSRLPHWLFDVTFYEEGAPDLTPETLIQAGFLNSYDHFLRVGSAEGRIAHPLFDSYFYQTQLSCLDVEAEHGGACPFTHYLYRSLDHQQDIPTSIYFDPAWYNAVYPKYAGPRTGSMAPLQHYLTNDTPTAFDPLPDFSEQYYLNTYADVAEAVKNQIFPSGYLHFLNAGVFEFRSPTRHINLRYYWETHESVRRAVQSGQMRDAFVHLLTVGTTSGLMRSPFQPAPDIPEEQTRALFSAQAQSLLPLYGRKPLDFSFTGPPACSVIIVLNNGFLLSMQTIASLRQNYPGNLELILIDSGSVDEVQKIGRYVTGARTLRFDDNIGFSKACNVGLELATSNTVLFINSDVRLEQGAVAAALRRLTSDPTIGAVGGKVIRTNETLQEAGCIIWRDGWTLGYLRDQSPLSPEACFMRDVDFCSAVFLMARMSLIRQLGGFDQAFSPAYFEDADLGIRIWQAGFRVVYDPAVVLHHYEYGSSRDAQSAKAMMHTRQKLFFQKHIATLRFRHAASPAGAVFARAVDTHHRRILFIDDIVPLPALGSGYGRANDIIRVMASLDYQVTVFPMLTSVADVCEIDAEFPDTVEVMHNRSARDLPAFLDERRGYYDCIWISRTHNLDQARPLLEAAALLPTRTRIILDTEAVAAPRAAMAASLRGEPVEVNGHAALREEFRNAYFCQHVLTVNDKEARMLTALGIPDVRTLGTMRAVAPTERPWQKRSGILFLGSLHATDTPNYDSLCWFVEEVLPYIEADLGYETRLTIAGYVAPGVPMERFAAHSRVTVLGAVTGLPLLYDRHRVVVAPTRFAAGTPYKVYEAASFGVPVVATTLLGDQLAWRDGEELLSTDAVDPAGFAERVVALYRSEPLWTSVREAALSRLQSENTRENYVLVLKNILPPQGIDRGWSSH